MEDRRKDLKGTKQVELVTRLVTELFERDPSLYYLSTIEVATEIENYIAQPGNILSEDRQILKGLDRRDIQILLSLHH